MACCEACEARRRVVKRVVNTYHWLVGHGAVLQEDTDDLRLSKLGGQEERGYPIVILTPDLHVTAQRYILHNVT
jgi:hypothetical protein